MLNKGHAWGTGLRGASSWQRDGAVTWSSQMQGEEQLKGCVGAKKCQ